MVYQSLREAGHRTALYTSPHLVDVRERFVVDGRPISRSAFAMWTDRLRPDIEAQNASFFEATTAVAFADFAARGADVAVVEVGLGGRLDSTNVITPLVSAVVSLGLDHAEYLGDSLDDVAREKSGIAKRNRPFVIGERDGHLARELERHAHEAGALPDVVRPGAAYDGPIGLVGEHQRRNASIARRVLMSLPAEWRPSGEAIGRGIATAWLPGRIDRRGRWLFDVAHNPDAMRCLTRVLRANETPRPIHAIVGILGDKDWRGILAELQPVTDALWLVTSPNMPASRRWDPAAVCREVGGSARVEEFDDALRNAQQGAGTVVVTGSFYTVGDAMSRLPGFEPLG